MARTAAFTICAKNYLHSAITLHSSLAKHHPDWDLFVCLVDDLQGTESLVEANFKLLSVDEFDIPNKSHFFFQYQLLELCTAVKPWGFNYFVSALGYERVVYFDADIKIYSEMTELVDLYDSGAGIIFTPHLTGSLNDGFLPGEREILLSGTWNLGFCAVDNSVQSKSFIYWWQERLEYLCISDVSKGYFLDQKWCDLVPGLFDNFVALNHEGYNAAYWNLSHRNISTLNDKKFVNDAPLRFFHFSGFKPASLTFLSIHENRQTLRDNPEIRLLAKDYARELFLNGYDTYTSLPNTFETFVDGKEIPNSLRRYFLNSRKAGKPILDINVNPFESSEYFTEFSISGHPILRFTYSMLAVWDSRPDLKRVFPDPQDEDLQRFIEWLVEYGSRENVLPQSQIAKSQEELSLLHQQKGQQQPTNNLLRFFTTKLQTQISNLTFGVNLTGYVTMESGLGQGIRNCIAALSAKKIPYSISDISNTRNFSNIELPYPINLFYVNADSISNLLRNLKSWEDKYNIGYWHWELPTFPKKFHKAIEHLDEIWTCSQFIADAISTFSDIPVSVIPHAINIPAETRSSRDRFELPNDKFLFLVMFDTFSFSARKNPRAAIEAFAKLDAKKLGLGLVIKIMNSYRDLRTLFEIEQLISGLDNCFLIDETLSRQDIYDLQQSCDCLVSLHRSEGYGLCLAECMALGKPVVATNWSGNIDFMNESNSCLVNYKLVNLDQNCGPYEAGQSWAEPDTKHASEYMERLASDLRYREKIAKNAKNYMHQNNSFNVIGSYYRSNIERIMKSREFIRKAV